MIDPEVLALSGQVETLRQALTLYEQVCLPAGDYAVRTQEEYARDVADLITFLHAHGVTTLKAVSLLHLTAYQAEMKQRGYTLNTRRRKLFAIKGFFTFLADMGMLRQNVADRLVPYEAPVTTPRFLSEAEYQRLRGACQHHPRNAALVELLLQTGLSLSEAATLQLADLELPTSISRHPDATGSLRVARASGGVTVIPLNYKACQALATYLAHRVPMDGALFLNKASQPLSKRSIQKIITAYLEQAGISQASVRTLRHTAAAHYLADGLAEEHLVEMFGINSDKTRKSYKELAKKALRQAVQAHAL